MTDPFRGGGFGSIGFGPFGNSGGGDSRYLIANDGDAVAATKKYSAQIAWANGTITDDAYLGALKAYRDQTDKGSRERVSADNELSDAIYTIGRNKIIRSVNQAATSTLRVAALRRLIGYDRRKLGTMKHDNEQYRELSDRIADSESQVRQVRYADLVRKFNANQVGIDALLSFARNAALGSRGGPDHEDWLDKVRDWTDRSQTERINQLYQDYEHERIPGSTVIGALRDRLAGMSKDSPQYAETQRAIEDLEKRVREKELSDRDNDMASRLANGTVSNAAYLRYLHRRIEDYPKGSSDRRSAQDTFMQASYNFGEADLIGKINAGDAQSSDLVSFYRGYQATMNVGSAKYLEIQAKITDLLIQGAPALDIGLKGIGGYAGAGRWVDLTGAPGGTPVNAQGFASQFDGSAFASNNCGMASAAMMAWAASGGKVRVSGGDLRYYSGDRNQAGDEAGTTFEDITIAYQQVGLGLEQRHGMAFNQWKRRLMQGEGSLINGYYGDAPANLRLTNSSDFTHTMYVDRAKRMPDGSVWFLVMDPLARNTTDGARWWPESAIKQYGWSGTANNGGQWMGDVAFAAKRGRSSTYINPDRDPTPYQAFDTDAEGRSTIGKGGGTSRAEAGRRHDWSKGKQGVAPTEWPQWQAREGFGTTKDKARPVTDDQIDEFLAAVDGVRKPNITDPTEWGVQKPGDLGDPDARRARAKAILGEWGGDARLAAVAWFTGDVQPDASKWGNTERFYANAVGTRLGYEPVRRGSTLVATTGQTVNGAAQPIDPMTPPGTLDMTTNGPRPSYQQGRATEGIPTETADIGRKLLEELGVEPTPDMVRAVVAWMAVGGKEIVGNNPGSLHTNGIGDLPGQVAKGADSSAVFGTLDDGIKAWADEIRRGAPQITMAARTGDPERFLVAIDRSEWVPGGYQGTLIPAYNAIPGEAGRLIVGGLPRLLDGPADLQTLARQEPTIAELFDVDPRDPVQMDWLDRNIRHAKDALESGADTWWYESPGGQQVQVGFHPSMVSDLTGIKVSYLTWTKAAARTNDEFAAASKALATATDEHNRNVTTVAHDEWKAQVDAYEDVRQAAAGSNDIATYLNATFAIRDATALFLGLDPNAPLDANTAPNAEILRSTGRFDDVVRLIDSIDVRNVDDPATANQEGDPILELWAKGYVVPQRDSAGNIVSATLAADKAYWAWEGGKLKARTIENAKDDFLPVEIPTTGLAGATEQPPRYTQENVLLTMGGSSGYVKRGAGQVRSVILTASGYREAVVPTAPARPGASPGSVVPDPRRTMFPNGALGPGGANIASWRLGDNPGTPRAQLVSVATPRDRMLATAGQMVDVDMVSTVNPFTHELETWYSIPGSNVWLGGDTNSTQKNPPVLVLDGMTIKDGKLSIGGETYDPAKHGPLSGHVHWYGSSPADGAATGDYGAPGTHWRVRQGAPTAGGGVGFDTAPGDPTTAFLEGDIALTSMLGGGPTRRLAPDGRPEYAADIAKGTSTSTSLDLDARTRPGREAGLARVLAGVDFNAAVNGVSFEQQMAAVGQAFGPMNAGASARPPAIPLIGNIGSERLSSGVRSAAANAQAIADATRARAQAQRDTAIRLQRIADAQRAAEERARQAARLQATVSPTPRPTSQPTPRPTQAPPGMGQLPTTAPRPTVPPPVSAPVIPTAPKPKTGTTPQEHGMF